MVVAVRLLAFSLCAFVACSPVVGRDTPDAALADSGIEVRSDAGLVDAGLGDDAGVTLDGGAGSDAGGTDDAGSTADAGGTDDAGEPVDPCATITCAALETCVNGACVSQRCGTRVCSVTERCSDAGTCLEAACVGVSCLPGEVCSGGSCLPVDCAGQPCPSGSLCVDEVCVERACASVSCDGGQCRAGACQPPSCGDAGVCTMGFACVSGRCDDVRCVSVTCTTGFQCVAGACVAGCTASQTNEASCNNTSDDDCDGLVDCADPDCATRACVDDGATCTRDVCGGGVCTHPPEVSGVVCRASIGGCDVAERCTGASTACPADTFSATCACPERGPLAGYSEGSGLRSITASSFVLRDTNTWLTNAARIDALALPRVALDALPLNRTATRMTSRPWPGFGGGFFWASGDLTVPYWIPQGLAGGAAGAKLMVAVSWHYDETDNSTDSSPPVDGTDKGVRVSFADVTALAAGITYRHVLLVEPDVARGFKPIGIHAGGLAWSGTLLYVADTNRGLRVFDLTRILEVSTATTCNARAGVANGQACAYGYQFVLPQVGSYVFPTGLSSSCRPSFSFVSLDRSTAPDSLISGEYDNDPTFGIYSRVLRWPLAAGSSRLATGPGGIVTATGAWYAGNRNVQGAIASGPKFFLNSTRNSGTLFTGVVGAASTNLRASNDDWGWMPEGMHLSAAGNLWVSTEGHASLDRCVYFVRAADVP